MRPVPGQQPTWHLRLEPAPLERPSCPVAARTWHGRGGRLLVDAVHGRDRHFVQFEDVAEFLIDTSACLISCHRFPHASGEHVRHLFLDQVLPRLVSHLGRTVLHASAVATGAGAVAFVGTTGAGKSTLAAGMLAAGFDGLGDDALLVAECDGELTATPAYAGLRLQPPVIEAVLGGTVGWTTSGILGAKTRLVGPDGDTGRMPLCGVFVLEACSQVALDGTEVTELHGAQAVRALLPHTFLLDSSSRLERTSQLDTLARLAETVPVRSLRYPHRLESLPAVCRRVAEVSAGQLEVSVGKGR